MRGEIEIGLEIGDLDVLAVFKMSDSLNYDIIMGTDILQHFKFRIDFEKRT